VPPDLPSRLDSPLDAFDAAWQLPEPPCLEDFLPPTANPDRPVVLAGLVRIDLERRLQRGEPIRVENYLSRFPELRRDSEALLGLVQLERRLRKGHNPAFDGGNYPERFPELQSQLALSFQTVSEAGPVRTAAGLSDGNGSALDLRDYVLLDRVGKGGMGEVYRGRDPALNRSLAVKVLRAELRGHAEAERRFEQEARINGVLQHPSIVPVHNLGRLPDGRLYFTMKLVRGRTLADMLAAETDRPARLPELLGIFEKVCQAVAYAHSRKVLHRDLKPQNVMVGAFGEVQVMDWGLAKVQPLRAPASAGESTLGVVFRTKRPGSTGGDEEPTGVVGTPPYMAPEQARGESEELDERADVFGLGGLLCVLLTGQPPFTGPTRDAVLRKAAAGELAEALARLNSCGADRELVALCSECLAARAEDRPRNAGVLAARMAAYQAAVQERLRKAELHRAAAEARAEEEAKTRRVAEGKAAAERRARRLTVGLAAALLLLIVVGGGAAGFSYLKRQQANTAVSLVLDEARRRSEAAWDAPLLDVGQFREALALAQKADDLTRTGGASQELRQQAAALVAEIDQQHEAAKRDQKLLAAALEVRRPQERTRYSTDDRGLALVLAEPSVEDQFQDAFRKWDLTFDIDAVGTEELAARLRQRPPAVVRDVGAALDEWASWRRRTRPDESWQRAAQLAAALAGPDSVGDYLRRLLAADTLAQEQALGMLSMALRPVRVPFDVGLLGERRRLEKLVREMDVAQAPTLRLSALIRVLWYAGSQQLAVRRLQEALRARRPDAQDVLLYHLLGQMLEAEGRWSEAVEWFALARQQRPELGASLAHALVKGNKVNEALGLLARLTSEQPDNPSLHAVHGYALHMLRRPKEAEAAYREAIRLQPDYPKAHYNLGVALDAQGRPKEAEAAYRDAIRLNPDFPMAHYNLGVALNAQGRPKEAEAAYRDAIRLNPDFPEAHCGLGVALSEQRRPKEAEAAYREAIRLHPDDPDAHFSLGDALRAQGRQKEAEVAYRKALRLKPDDPEAHNGLGNSLNDQRRYKEADAAYRQAIRLNPDYAIAQCNLGNVLRNQGRFAEALEPLRRGDALGRKSPAWPYPSTDWVRQCERLVELDGKLRASLRGEAVLANAQEQLELASLCRHPSKGLHATAARLIADAFANDRRLADDLNRPYRYNAARSAARAAAGQAEDARQLPDKAIAMWRRQALLWVRADLAAYAKQAEGNDARLREFVRQRLAHWQEDSDLASVRDKDALDALPADERQPWRQLWADVAALLKKIGEKK
jgi:serine/threonine-protein kinase